jgi:hypothetical protein
MLLIVDSIPLRVTDLSSDDSRNRKLSLIKVMKDTQEALMEFGNLRLHKFASNDPNVMSAFPSDDLAT